MTRQYMTERRQGTLAQEFTDYTSSLLYYIGDLARRGKVFNLKLQHPNFTMRTSTGFFTGTVVDLEYSGEDAVERFVKGYVRLVRHNDHQTKHTSKDWGDNEKLRFARTLGDGVSYGLRVDTSHIEHQDYRDRDLNSFGHTLFSIVPEIAEQTPAYLNGIATTDIRQDHLGENWLRDRRKLIDGVKKFGFEAAGLKEPGKTSKTGLYNVCLEPLIVDEQGLVKFIDQALSLGLRGEFSFQFERQRHFGKDTLVVNLSRGQETDHFGISLNTIENSDWGRYASRLLGLDSNFLSTQVSYVRKIVNPKWTAEYEEKQRIKKERIEERKRRREEKPSVLTRAGSLALGAAKWGTIPVWGPFYGSYRLANRACGNVRAYFDKLKSEKLERQRAEKRFNDRVSQHIQTQLGIPANKDHYESCVVGVSPEYVEHLRQEFEAEDEKLELATQDKKQGE